MKPLFSYAGVVVFAALHVAAFVGALSVAPTRADLFLALALYVVRMFGITAGYHRYFSHRSYRTNRMFQAVLAVLGGASGQRGALWWAAWHRIHHAFADTARDPHSPRVHGVLEAHLLWFLRPERSHTDYRRVPDLAKYPELVWLDQHYLVPPAALAIACAVFGGVHGFVWGFLVSTVVLYHCTYLINSAGHLWGTRAYDTRDDSRNSFVLAVITLGEGWHNNHHYAPTLVNMAHRWWQIDVSWMVLRTLAVAGIVWDLKVGPAPRTSSDEQST